MWTSLRLHLILVVQRRVGHRDAADEHGREPRDGRDRTGAPDLDVDPEHLGRHLFRRELVRHGPARFARDEPERALRGERVDLVDDAVDVERQAAAPLGDALVERDEVGGAAGDAPLAIHRQPGALEEVEQPRVSGGQREPLRLPDAIRKKAQRSLRRHRRIELAHRPRGGVARIDEGLLSRRQLALVQPVEVAPVHVDLAADFQHRRRPGDGEHLRDRADRAHVARHVLAHLAVAAGRSHGEPALLVAEIDREAVELELGDVLDRRRVGGEPQVAAHAGVELRRGFGRGVGFGANRQHRHDMAHRLELLERHTPDALRRRIGCDELRMRRLDGDELAVQAVVLGIGNGRRVLDVVTAVVRGDFASQRRGACCGRSRGVAGSLGARGVHRRMGGEPRRRAVSRRTARAPAGCPARC